MTICNTKDDCNGGTGICSSDGNSCTCFFGYFGKTCSERLGDKDHYETSWLVARLIIGIGYILLFLFASVIISKILRVGDIHKPKNRIALQVLGAFALYDLWTGLIFLIDPVGEVILPMAFLTLYGGYGIFMGFYFLGCILNYWVQVFHITKNRFRREAQLMKIASNYNPQVTLQDIENALQRMNKWRIPYIVTLVVIAAIQIPYIAMGISLNELYLDWVVLDLIVNIILYFIFCIAFFIYEKMLLRLIDTRETEEVTNLKRMSLKVRLFCIISMVTVFLVTIYAILFRGPAYTFVLKVVTSLEQWVVTLMIFSIYVDLSPSKLKVTLATLLTGADDSDSNTLSSGNGGSGSGSGKENSNSSSSADIPLGESGEQQL